MQVLLYHLHPCEWTIRFKSVVGLPPDHLDAFSIIILENTVRICPQIHLCQGQIPLLILQSCVTKPFSITAGDDGRTIPNHKILEKVLWWWTFSNLPQCISIFGLVRAEAQLHPSHSTQSSQDGSGWEGSLRVTWSQTPAQARWSQSTGLCPENSGISPGRRLHALCGLCSVLGHCTGKIFLIFRWTLLPIPLDPRGSLDAKKKKNQRWAFGKVEEKP